MTDIEIGRGRVQPDWVREARLQTILAATAVLAVALAATGWMIGYW